MAPKWEFEESTDNRKVLEYLLYRRKHPLIELGLARYGYASVVLKRLFLNGTPGIRCAVLSNPSLFERSLFRRPVIIDLRGVVIRAHRAELEALALNPYLTDDFYVNLIERKEYFADITEDNYQLMLYHLGDNPRLSTPFDETILDGWSDYKYNSVFTAAWNLTQTTPATQEWALVLLNLLRKALPPHKLDNLEQVVERWRIDPPKQDADKY
ncbi:MAG: hypothetical protein OEN50_17985, partial [Deltaproteobacteria bacterium]|nr:hypothetical protein [Deltaproteobacteria bacterium]